MSYTITNSSWSLIDDSNSRYNERRGTEQKSGEALVAAKNSSMQTVSNLQQFEKDILLPTDHYLGKNLDGAEQQDEAASKPQLPVPQKSWAAFQDGDDGHTVGLISIIGSVLAMQAKTNSNFWGNLWKQASQSMMTEVEFAPVIGAAIEGQYDAEAKATESQAAQASAEGVIGMVTFGVSVFAAGILAGSEDAAAWKDADDVGQQNETKALNAPKQSTIDQAKTMTEDELRTSKNQIANQSKATDELNNKNRSLSEGKSKAFNTLKKGFTKGGRFMQEWIGKSVQTVTAAQMLSDSTTKVTVTAPAQLAQAKFKKQQGNDQALSQEAQQYSQFYGQDFSRTEDLRQGSGQNIDYAMNIFKSAADTITQTVNSMFRG